MLVFQKIKTFKNDERGSLLIFFALCLTFLLGILALSFDMGRRAATQTDMQSFADNVALAAAGELDGQNDSIARARLAATSVIIAANESLKGGTAGSNFTITFDPNVDLVFYEKLPDNDNSLRQNFQIQGLEATKYQLPPTDEPTNGGGNSASFSSKAQYVGVRLDTVDVDWLFGKVFSSNDLPSKAVGAVAIASYVAYTCDIAPLMFCMPRTTEGDNSSPVATMKKGDGLLLRSGGNANNGNTAAWGGGDFGFLDLDKYIQGNNTCDRFKDQKSRDACILNELENVAACYKGIKGVDMEPGQRVGLDAAMYNMRFGLFRSGYKSFAGLPLYAPGPHAVRGIVPQNSSQDVCTAENVIPSSNTMPFPEDDCFLPGATIPCTRWGNGVWNSQGYYDHNYGVWDPNDSDGADGPLIRFSGTGGDISQKYLTLMENNQNYFADLGLPAAYDALDDVPAGETAVWPDFRVQNADTRYEVYKGEIERAKDLGKSGFGSSPAQTLAAEIFYDVTTLTTLSDGNELTGEYSMYPILPNRDGDNGLPVCKPDPDDVNSGTPVVAPATVDGIEMDRRVITIAGIDCGENPVNGADTNVPVFQYYRAFLMKPVGDDGNNPPKFDIWMEIIQPIGSGGGGGTLEEALSRISVQLAK